MADNQEYLDWEQHKKDLIAGIGGGGGGLPSNIVDPADGQALVYDATTGKWKNAVIDLGGILVFDGGDATPTEESSQSNSPLFNVGDV